MSEIVTPTSLREVREVIREEPLMHDVILQVLEGKPLTVPALALAIAKPSDEVLYWVMGMRRYGLIVEVPEADDDGYFSYAAVKKEASL